MGAGEYSVAVVALDDEIDIRASNIAIKIDVEGYELEVLTGAASLLCGNGGYAQIEGHGSERVREISERMKSYGWRLIDHSDLNLFFERA